MCPPRETSNIIGLNAWTQPGKVGHKRALSCFLLLDCGWIILIIGWWYISICCNLIRNKSVSKDEMFKNDQAHVPADFRMSYLASQTLQFVKASIIHHQSVLPPRVPRYPREDGCGSNVLWAPDGTFLTIRFRLPSWNDLLPVCDTNVSLSDSNEGKAPKLKSKISLFIFLVCICPKNKVVYFASLGIINNNVIRKQNMIKEGICLSDYKNRILKSVLDENSILCK